MAATSGRKTPIDAMAEEALRRMEEEGYGNLPPEARILAINAASYNTLKSILATIGEVKVELADHNAATKAAAAQRQPPMVTWRTAAAFGLGIGAGISGAGAGMLRLLGA